MKHVQGPVYKHDGRWFLFQENGVGSYIDDLGNLQSVEPGSLYNRLFLKLNQKPERRKLNTFKNLEDTGDVPINIWYMKRGCFISDVESAKNRWIGEPNIHHVWLGTLNVAGKRVPAGIDLNEIWFKMQGHNWSPGGEACSFIEALDTHTSMSIGDLIEVLGRFYTPNSFGFTLLTI